LIENHPKTPLPGFARQKAQDLNKFERKSSKIGTASLRSAKGTQFEQI
jgi:hypothetical protein